jgi:hypothetical protein
MGGPLSCSSLAVIHRLWVVKHQALVRSILLLAFVPVLISPNLSVMWSILYKLNDPANDIHRPRISAERLFLSL